MKYAYFAAAGYVGGASLAAAAPIFSISPAPAIQPHVRAGSTYPDSSSPSRSTKSTNLDEYPEAESDEFGLQDVPILPRGNTPPVHAQTQNFPAGDTGEGERRTNGGKPPSDALKRLLGDLDSSKIYQSPPFMGPKIGAAKSNPIDASTGNRVNPNRRGLGAETTPIDILVNGEKKADTFGNQRREQPREPIPPQRGGQKDGGEFRYTPSPIIRRNFKMDKLE